MLEVTWLKSLPDNVNDYNGFSFDLIDYKIKAQCRDLTPE